MWNACLSVVFTSAGGEVVNAKSYFLRWFSLRISAYIHRYTHLRDHGQ